MVGHIGLSKEERGRADFVVPTGRGGAGNVSVSMKKKKKMMMSW